MNIHKEMKQTPVAMKLEDVSLSYGEHRALSHITLSIHERKITSLIGPSGCGKSSLLGVCNRINELKGRAKISGKVLFNGEDIYSAKQDLTMLRRRVGMVFQHPNPFPKSVYENVAFGLRLSGLKKNRELDERVEKALKAAALWDEVKDKLDVNACFLSGGQQQRLCIARAIAIEPEVLLLDEPTSALDPISTLTIEELLYRLKSTYTIVVVTHNMQQAVRISDFTAFMDKGEVIEYTDTDTLFTQPKLQATEDYITGRYG